MSNPTTSFSFTVSDAKGLICPVGIYQDGAGVAVQLGEGYERAMVEQGVNFLASERAAVSVNLVNGWTVAREQK